MGQFIVVSSTNPATAQDILSSCMDSAQTLFSQALRTQYTFGGFALATFSRQAMQDESGRLHAFKEADAWCLGVGTWVQHQGLTAEQQAYRLAASHRQPAKLEAQLADIDGSYCFVTGTTSGDQVRVITDPIGQLHVYTLRLTDAVLISTSALLLAHVGGMEWDPLAVREFLAKGTVFEDRSLFRGVRKIAPATIQTYENARQKHRTTYWSVRDHVESSQSSKRSLEAFSSAIQAGVAETFRQFGNPALDLTGGFDSRILLGSAREALPSRPLNTVVSGAADDPDVIAAAHIARCLGLEHERLDNHPGDADVWWDLAKAAVPLVDGECNILEYANILFVHRQLAPRFGVSVNGSGGELIRGYWWELLFPRVGARNHFDTNRVALRRFATDPWAEPLLAYPYADTLSDHFADVVGSAGVGLQGCRNTACMDNIYLTLRMQRWQGRISSATNRVWPCLSPLLFRGPMEIALGAAISLRRNGRMARRLLADMDHELARLPMAGGYPALPITPANLPQFLPLGKEYLQRIKNRFVRTSTTSSGATRHRQPDMPALLRHEEVADMLDPVKMLTAELYGPQSLRALTASIANGHVPVSRSGRVITLESVARLKRSLPT